MNHEYDVPPKAQTMTKRRAISVVLLLVTIGIGLYYIELAVPKYEYFLQRPGNLLEHAAIESEQAHGLDESVHLVSSTGLEVDLRVLRPMHLSGEKLPVILMIGGHRTGKNAVDLVGMPQDIGYVAIDYPYHGSRSLRGFRQSVAAIPAIQQAFLDTPPALSLTLDWLLTQSWVDPDRIELVGISLGVPFAAVAGALDERFTRIWLIHGAGDNLRWLLHAAEPHVENPLLRGLASRTALLLVYGNSFDTKKWISDIAPRPLIIVAAREDERVPLEAQQSLIDAAESEFVELIWVEGGHVHPNRQAELERLLDVVLSRVTRDTA